MATYLEFKNMVLTAIDEYSSRGTVLAASKNADLVLRIPIFINDVLMDIAREAGKISATTYIVHDPICNDSTYDTSEILQHLPGVAANYEYPVAKSYFLEATGPATIYIQEETSTGTWNTLSTLTLTTSNSTFAEYKANITAASTITNIRLSFDGSYLYHYRNHILYPYAFPLDTMVQQHRPYFLYDLPSNFLKLQNIYVRKEPDLWVEYATAFLVDGELKLGINRYDVGEYQINYWRKPSAITITGVTATDDAQTVDVNPDALYAAVLGVAAKLMATENMSLSGYLLNQYEAEKASLVQTDKVYPSTMTNVKGW